MGLTNSWSGHMFILGTGISDTCVHTLLQVSDVFKKFNVETYTETYTA